MEKRLGRNKNEIIITISLSDLIAVALLYNFLANGSTSLYVGKVLNLYYYISNSKYYNKKDSYMFTMKERKKSKKFDKSVEYNIEGKYEAINLENLVEYYRRLPIDIINKTLTKEALHLIGVAKEDLDIVTNTRDYSNCAKIQTMHAEDAKKYLLRTLDEKGFKNIIITEFSYQGTRGDHTYSISYTAEEVLESLDQEKVKVKVSGTQN